MDTTSIGTMNKLIIVLPFIVSNIVRILTAKPDTYPTKTPLQPPGYLFGIAWSIIYLLYGAYLYRICTTREPNMNYILFLWTINFIVNLMWYPIVIDRKKHTMGVYMIVFLISTLIGLLVNTENVTSKNLLIPYISWLVLALLLNVELVASKRPSLKSP